MSDRKGFGAGLTRILPNPDEVVAQDHESATGVALDVIYPNPYQPRKTFDETALAELSASIRMHGVLQPIVVRNRPDGGYWLVAGERRCRAAREAGLEQIPAVVRDLSDRDALGLALVENIQREDLNVLEEAESLRQLIDEFELSHQQAADIVGRSRATVSNLLRVQELASPAVRTQLSERQIEMGHARALLPLAEDDQATAVEEVVARGLTVRQTEQLVRRLQSPLVATQTLEPPAVELPGAWSERVSLSQNARGTDVRLRGLTEQELTELVAWLAKRDT